MSNSALNDHAARGATPVVTELTVVPVAGQDSMLMNLSGAHGPYFTRNIVILKDSAGNTGVGEVPGGEPIRKTLEDAPAAGGSIVRDTCRASADGDRPDRDCDLAGDRTDRSHAGVGGRGDRDEPDDSDESPAGALRGDVAPDADG